MICETRILSAFTSTEVVRRTANHKCTARCVRCSAPVLGLPRQQYFEETSTRRDVGTRQGKHEIMNSYPQHILPCCILGGEGAAWLASDFCIAGYRPSPIGASCTACLALLCRYAIVSIAGACECSPKAGSTSGGSLGGSNLRHL